MRARPVIPASEDPAMAQQEGQQLLALASKVVRRSQATTHQIAHRLVDAVGHPDPRQLTGPKQAGQRHRIPPVGLHPVAGSTWDQ